MTERRLLEREGRLVWRLTCIYMSVLLFTVVLGLLFGQHAVARTISFVVTLFQLKLRFVWNRARAFA